MKRAKNRKHNKKSLKTLSKFNNEIWLFYIETLPVIIVLLFHCRRGGKINGFSPVTYNVFFIHPLARPPARTSAWEENVFGLRKKISISGCVALSQMKDHPRSYVHLFQPAHNRGMEWWMNANVIKQFSVYLKLQTFTLRTPSRGRLAKNYFFLFSRKPTTRQCQENCFSFSLSRSCCFSNRRKYFMSLSTSSVCFACWLKFIKGAEIIHIQIYIHHANLHKSR